MSDFIWDSSCMAIENASGERIKDIASVAYNASISALEVRSLRPMIGGAPLMDAIGKGPVRFRLSHPEANTSPECVVHFEKATLGFPFECPAGTTAIHEVVILRGLRVEME